MMKKTSSEASKLEEAPISRPPKANVEEKKNQPPTFTRTKKPVSEETSNSGFEFRKATTTSDAGKPADKKDQPFGSGGFTRNLNS